MRLDEEIIKIFIEGRLVRYHSFSLFNDQVEKSSDGARIIFELRDSRLELKNVSQDRILSSIKIPSDMDSKDCMSFAMKSYLKIVQVIEKEKL